MKKRKAAPQAKPASDLWIYLFLAAAVLAVYLQVSHFDFVTLDDPVYVTENPHVQAGLCWSGMVWAFTTGYGGQWHPLTWLSHMLDCQFFGLDPGWPHIVNVLIHALTSLLWFSVLKGLTGARWRSAMAAFLFALHPLHVESVAWVCERKDVLSALFWVLTIWAYARYARQPERGRYLLALALFCLGLMAKPMLVTLPIVLLLLDRWPLSRGVRVVEKIPFFALAIAACVVTFVVHLRGEALPSFEVVPPAIRIENALVSYGAYILDLFWPAKLAVFYPYSSGSIVMPAIAAGIALVAITIFAIREFRPRPYLAVGWLWYLVALVPVIGLVQAGAQARADRFTYIPMAGLTIALIWGAAEILGRWPRARLVLASALCAACIALTWIQVGYWRDSVTLYRHAIEATTGNYVARFNLASVLDTRGETAEAIAQLRETVRLRPYFATAHAELGQLLAKAGLPQEALPELRTAVTQRPGSADAHFRLGSVLGAMGQNSDAAIEFAQGLRLQPENADGHYDLAIALAQTGNLADAAREFETTVRLKPDDADARFNLGITLARLHRVDTAIEELREAVRIRPQYADARQALDDLLRLAHGGGGR